MMTNVGMFDEAKLKDKVKELKARVKDLMNINKEHQMINGKLRSELSIEKKNHDLCRESNDLLNRENARMMKKLSK